MSITRLFPYGSVIVKMDYNTDKKRLTISFKKKVGTQDRTYEGVPTKTAYGLYYENEPKKIMSNYSNNVKNKFEVSDVKDNK